MSDVSFTPTFRHTAWIDNRDRVQAGGPNGFNVRFTALESDLDTLADVIAAVRAALDALGAQPPPSQRLLSLSPALVAVSGTAAWTHDSAGFAVRPSNQPSVAGLMAVSFPHGARLVALRALGQNTGSAALLRVSLMRSRLSGTPQPAERLVRVSGESNPFDARAGIDPALATVDTAAYRYFLLATADNAASGDVVTLSAFQIEYLAS
ncbi:hypothetical protein JNUCC64_30620 [Streptomyces sp. JNUCC 64]